MEVICFYSVYFALYLITIYMIISAFTFSSGNAESRVTEVNSSKLIMAGIYIVATLFHVIPAYALGARRLHDLNYSGWLQLANFIPYFGGLASFVFFILFVFIPGTPGENNYGPESENY